MCRSMSQAYEKHENLMNPLKFMISDNFFNIELKISDGEIRIQINASNKCESDRI